MEQTAGTPDASAGSSPAPVTSAQAVMDSLSHDERSSWEETGNLPDRVSIGPKSDATPADTSSAQPVEQAAETSASPVAAASETAKPADTRKEKGAKARNAELDTEITDLREKLRIRAALREELGREQPRQDARQPDPSPAAKPTPADYERYLAMPDAPQEADFDNYAKYSAAMGVFITDQRWQEHQSRAHQHSAIERQVQGVEQLGQTARARIEAATTADPDFVSKVDSGLLAIEPASVVRLNGGKVGPQHVLAEQILQSDHIKPLLEYFSTPEGKTEGASLMRLSYPDLMRAFGRIEARYDDGRAPSVPTPKTVSSAPAPPVTLGTRTADTADALESALKRKDSAAYIREANRRDLAAMGL